MTCLDGVKVDRKHPEAKIKMMKLKNRRFFTLITIQFDRQFPFQITEQAPNTEETQRPPNEGISPGEAAPPNSAV